MLDTAGATTLFDVLGKELFPLSKQSAFAVFHLNLFGLIHAVGVRITNPAGNVVVL